ncbi:epoxide hydrolase family protein [Agromyces sp. NPDC058484]|uniref:epoxide hydrolase family protein n=1 Tax=Agromyces sp. NPDC058484 TaxID=3346524 RepID=UPI00366110FA
MIEFRLNVADEQLESLHARLRHTRLSPDFANDDWGYGVEQSWLSGMIDYWADEFDWRAQEALMNAVPQFSVTIHGLPIHFQYVKGTSPRSIPLILSHGWPWTFWDWHGVIGPLTDPGSHGLDPSLSFDLVIPSLPGFGFSSPLRRPVGCRDVARVWDTLMHEVLEYPRYGAVGGDWGGKITGELAQLFPERVIGAYSTLQAVAGFTPSLDGSGRFAADEEWMEVRMAEARPLVSSHLEVHRRDPQTLAYALNDSPAGLAAWIWERRLNWRDPDTMIDEIADRDFLCTTASIYWFTQTIGTSMRFYRDNFGSAIPPRNDPSTSRITPMAFGITPKDVLFMPHAEAAASTNLERWSYLPRGGHFAAYEIPGELSADVHSFFASLRVVP